MDVEQAIARERERRRAEDAARADAFERDAAAARRNAAEDAANAERWLAIADYLERGAVSIRGRLAFERVARALPASRRSLPRRWEPTKAAV